MHEADFKNSPSTPGPRQLANTRLAALGRGVKEAEIITHAFLHGSQWPPCGRAMENFSLSFRDPVHFFKV